MSLFSSNAAELGKPYWWEHGVQFKGLTTKLPKTTELLVIGAGYTGLSAAIAAFDAGAQVVVVDAGKPGEGASTRNGGMFGAHPRLPFEALSNRYGESVAAGIFNEAQDAFDFTSSLIRNENINCHFDQCGRIQLAWTKAHFRAQQKQVAKLKAISSMNVELVEPADLHKDINSPCYFGGIRFADHASVHPRQFHDGLLKAVLERGIRVVEQCPLEQVEKVRDGFKAESSTKQSIKAEKVVMATNGYTADKHKWFYKRVFPLPSYLIATEALPLEQINKLAPGKRMMVETRARHSYFRVSPDGTRIVYGGRASMRPMKLELAATRLRETMVQVWPELRDVKLTHCWTGNTGFAFTHMPQTGNHNGISYSMGYSGSGVVLAPYLGAKAAYQALGDARGTTAYEKTLLEARWFHCVRKPLFLYVADSWYRQIVDRVENTAFRKGRK